MEADFFARIHSCRRLFGRQLFRQVRQAEMRGDVEPDFGLIFRQLLDF